MKLTIFLIALLVAASVSKEVKDLVECKIKLKYDPYCAMTSNFKFETFDNLCSCVKAMLTIDNIYLGVIKGACPHLGLKLGDWDTFQEQFDSSQ